MTSNTDTPLTEEQRLLVENNHNLIYYYANRNRLDLEEYYDVLAIGLCKAAKYYNESSGYAFTTYAMKALKNEHLQHMRKEFGKTQIPGAICVSLNMPVGGTDSAPLLLKDTIPDKTDRYEFSRLLCAFGQFSNKLTNKERAILCRLLDESSVTEVAKDLQISARVVAVTKHRVKKKWQLFQQIAREKENRDAG